jgi:hypothetical protein
MMIFMFQKTLNFELCSFYLHGTPLVKVEWTQQILSAMRLAWTQVTWEDRLFRPGHDRNPLRRIDLLNQSYLQNQELHGRRFGFILRHEF